ncbi:MULTISPECIES: hypothetical protein [Providencia]|uniref:hypothetical protein n=1 Tax=Providencia TaxID=586 RepID=UPI0012B5319F|nr:MULTISPECIES: hypothetical protein [Providencia]MBC5790788.1 hypothetical protein [Providencia sp. JUb39]MTB45850.1 hypothetical protein [Providencia sp. wls1950]MTC40960.1 hypothetical protein [Providencia sp. wls1921]UBX48841.1 hypothetical protein LDO51_17150 [Providencia alcalifaciens]
MFVDSELLPDPDNINSVLGWGVVKYNPWHLDSVHATKTQAELRASLLGNGYKVHYGSHKLQSDDFIWNKVS